MRGIAGPSALHLAAAPLTAVGSKRLGLVSTFGGSVSQKLGGYHHSLTTGAVKNNFYHDFLFRCQSSELAGYEPGGIWII